MHNTRVLRGLLFCADRAILKFSVGISAASRLVRRVSTGGRPHAITVYRTAPCNVLVARNAQYAEEMANKLYVGNLPYSTTGDELQQTFSQAGQVSEAVVMMDKMTGRSRGFGFVTMASDEDAQKAVEMFNGKDFGGRAIVVNEARPMEQRAPRSDRGGFGGGY